MFEYGYPNLTWSDNWGISWNTLYGFDGRLETDQGVWYAINNTGGEYGRDYVAFHKSLDHGQTWSPEVNLGMSGWNDWFLGIHMIGTTLIVYSDNGPVSIVKSEDYGLSWTDPIPVAQVYWTDPKANDLVYFNGKLFMLLWNETGDPTYSSELLLVESSDMGDTWGNVHRIGWGSQPLIKVDGGSMYVTYFGLDADMQPGVCFMRTGDGVSWTDPILLGTFVDYTDTSNHHSLVASGGVVAESYLDYRVQTPTNRYYLHINISFDSGNTWEDLGDVTGTYNAQLPLLFIGDGKLHFIYADMGTSDNWGSDYPIMYRWRLLDQGQIPEMPSIALAVCGFLAIVIPIVARKSLKPR